ncbi:MAG: hypothetical protein HC876_14980 [Chloroflexaceae bacterium]|nr:hypothetical protein [Chloroflexaceae bacterium]NJO06713.1 hypothetical protein [Chloroflexaceae bacterium]
MSALISFGLLYVIMAVRRFSWVSMVVFLLPAALLLSILVRGLIGAPLWIVLSLDAETWAVTIGVVSTLILLGLGIHVFGEGLGKIELELA